MKLCVSTENTMEEKLQTRKKSPSESLFFINIEKPLHNNPWCGNRMTALWHRSSFMFLRSETFKCIISTFNGLNKGRELCHIPQLGDKVPAKKATLPPLGRHCPHKQSDLTWESHVVATWLLIEHLYIVRMFIYVTPVSWWDIFPLWGCRARSRKWAAIIWTTLTMTTFLARQLCYLWCFSKLQLFGAFTSLLWSGLQVEKECRELAMRWARDKPVIDVGTSLLPSLEGEQQ